jgi:hypothetical protein
MAKVLDYRVYKLNAAGRFVTGEWIAADDDGEARRLAHGMCGDGTPTVELWLGVSRIAVLHCDGGAIQGTSRDATG